MRALVFILLALAACTQPTACGVPPDCADAGAHQVMPGPGGGGPC